MALDVAEQARSPRHEMHHQHARDRPHREGEGKRLCQLWGSAARQAHRKDRTFARLARHGHVAAHHARELAGEGETESRAAEALRGRSIGLAELLEQLGLLLRCHADAGVGDGELDEAAAIAHLACRKLDLARFGELARIAQKVEQYLPQPHGVHGEDT